MTTPNEEFTKVLRYLADELVDPERDDEGVEILIDSLMELGPEVDDFTFQSYQTLKTALKEAEGLRDDLHEAAANILYECAVGVRRSALEVLARACRTTPVDEELINACFDILLILTDDSPLSNQGLDDDQLTVFRGLSTVLAEHEDYELLLYRYEELEIANITSLSFYLEEEVAADKTPLPQPETKSLFKGLLSSLRKAG